MDSVCQTCGDTGFQELLVHCSECGASPEHRYCLIKLPHRDEQVHRLCEQCNNESPKIVSTGKVLAGRDMDNMEDVDKQIPIPAKTVSLQGLKRGPTTSLLHVAHTEDEDCGHTSLEQKEGQKSKRCKLILDDDDDEELEQKFQSDCDVQSAPIKGLTRGPTRHVAQTEDEDCGHTLEQKEGQKSKRCKLVLDDDDEELEQKFQSDCDIQSAPIKGLTRAPTRRLRHVAQTEAKDCGHTSLEQKEGQKSKRCKLVLDDDDEEEELERKFQSDCDIQSAPIKGLTRGPTRSLLHVAQTEAKDCGHTSLEEKEGQKSRRCKLVLDNDDEEELEQKFQSDCDVQSAPIKGLTRRVAQTEDKDCGHTSLEEKGGQKSKRCKLVLDDDDKELEQKFQSDCDLQSAPIKGLTRSPTRSLLHAAQTEDKDGGHTSLEQKGGQKSKRCKLVLDDDVEELEQKFQSDCDVQSAPIKPTSQPNDSSASLPSAAPVLTSADMRAPHEVMNGMQLACTTTSGCQQEETNATQPVAAKPIIDCVWRGSFCIGNEEYGPLYGHLSNKACEKVFNVSKLLPPYLRMEKLPRLEAWPNSFKTAPPTDDSIGLYFFPGCARVATILDQLLGEVINKDLVLKFVFDNVELLVFSATILPNGHQRFQGEYYLWGAFRAAQVPLLMFKSDCNPESNGVAKVNQTAEVSIAREKEVDGSKSNEVAEEIKKAVFTLAEEKEDYIDCCDEVLSDVTQNSPTAHKALRVSRFNRSKPLSCEKGREEKPTEEKFFPAREELEEGEICDVDYSICENLDDKKEDEEFRRSQTVDDRIQCLELFPLQVEDIGIIGKVGAVNELNLDLGLSCTARSRVPYDDRSDARSPKKLCRFL